MICERTHPESIRARKDRLGVVDVDGPGFRLVEYGS